MKYLTPLLLALTLCGCAPVYTSKPMGEKPKNLIHEVAEWEGTWINGKGEAVQVKVKDPANGILQAACIEEKENKLALKEYTIHLRESGKWCFASFRMDEFTGENGKEKELYFWARIATNERQVIFWSPDADKFKELVKKGQLPGKVNENETYLGALEPKHMELITSSSNGVLLDWENPAVFTKMSK